MLHDIMQAMLHEASRSNWQELSRLDSERRVLLQYVDRADPQQATDNTIADEQRHADTSRSNPVPEEEQLRRCLLALDQEINLTVQNAREALVLETRDLRAQHTAQQSYARANAMGRSYSSKA